MKSVSRAAFAAACILALLFCSSAAFAEVGDYSTDDVAAINAMIDNNGLNATKDDPDNWSFATWDSSTPKRLQSIYYSKGLTGKLVLACPELTELVIHDNWNGKGITDLDVSGCPKLERLDVSNNQLKNINVSQNAALKDLSIYNEEYTDKELITAIDVSSNKALVSLDVHGLKITSIKDVNATNNPALKKLNISNTAVTDFDTTILPTTMTELDVDGLAIGSLVVSMFADLKKLSCNNNGLTTLNVESNTNLTSLSCGNNQLNDLYVKKNTELTYLWCVSNKITGKLDVDANTKLTQLYCNGNDITTLDISSNDAIFELWCDDNRLSKLDLTNNTALKSISCSNNDISTIAVSHLKNLIFLSIGDTKIRSLDVSEDTELRTLWCDGLQLTDGDIDLSKNSKMQRLYIYGNKLTKLDTSHMKSLDTYDCSNNRMATIDVGSNLVLREFNCSDNGIKTLDLSKNTKLESLTCSSNSLAALDVSAQGENLIYLYCNNNELTALDLSKNTKLQSISCGSNKITALDISKIGNSLTSIEFWGNPITSFKNQQGHTITVVSSPDKDLAHLSSYNVDTENAEVWLSDDARDFSGWSAEPATVVLESPTNRWTRFVLSEDVKIIANTSPRAFTVTFIDAGDGAEGSGDHKVMDLVKAYAGVSEDRKFGGWQIVDAPNDFFMADQSSERTMFYMPAGDVTLRVLWGDAFPLIVNSLGVGATQGGMRSAGDVIDLYAGSRSGWKFKGWSVEPNIVKLDDATSRSTWFLMPRAQVTATADWEEIFYYHVGKYNNVIQSGSGSVWTPNTDAVILLDVDPDHIADVSADGRYLRVGIDYTVLDQDGNDIKVRGNVRAKRSGPISLKLLDSYLKTLAPGLYTFNVIIDDPNEEGLGTAEVTIRVSSTGGKSDKDRYIIGCSSGVGAIGALLALISAAAMRRRSARRK